eukprot:403339643
MVFCLLEVTVMIELNTKVVCSMISNNQLKKILTLTQKLQRNTNSMKQQFSGKIAHW